MLATYGSNGGDHDDDGNGGDDGVGVDDGDVNEAPAMPTAVAVAIAAIDAKC